MKKEKNMAMPVKLIVNDTGKGFHWHDEVLEIILVVRGSVQVEAFNKVHDVAEDQVLITNKMIPHKVTPMNQDSIFLTAHLDLEYFKSYVPLANSMFFKRYLDENHDNYDILVATLRNKIARVFIEMEYNIPNYQKHIANIGIDIMSFLTREYPYIDREQKNFRSKEQMERIWKAFRYVFENSSSKISLGEVAEHLHVSQSHLSHSIKELTGVTFEKWLNLYRTEAAMRMLLSTDMSMTKISYECGFSNPRYFIKYFKKEFGCLPMEYKKQILQMNQCQDEETVFLEEVDRKYLDMKMTKYLMGNAVTDFWQNDSLYSYVSFSMVEQGSPYRTDFNDMIDVGSYRNITKLYRQQQIAEMIHNIGFRYLKISRLFEETFAEYKEDGVIDWLGIFNIFDTVLSCGASPAISISKTEYDAEPIRNHIYLMIERLKAKYGCEIISKWRFFSDTRGKSILKSTFARHALQILDKSETKYKKEHLLFDTEFAAPYMIRSVCLQISRQEQLIHEKFPDALAFERPDSSIFHGENGLMTSNGMKKPLYYAYWFLSKLGNTCIKSGDNYIITRNKEDFQILFWNLGLNMDTEKLARLEVGYRSRYPVFATSKIHKIFIEIRDIHSNSYRVKRYLFGRSTCSVYDRFMDYSDMESRIGTEDIAYLNRTNGPRLTFDRISPEVEGEIISELEPNAVELILLEKDI